jgi:hypothetical protein
MGSGRRKERHDRIADELLDCASTPLELHADAFVVGREQRFDVLRVHRFRRRREADEVAGHDRDDLALAARRSPAVGQRV